MKLNQSKEWFEKNIDREEGLEIGAGHPYIQFKSIMENIKLRWLILKKEWQIYDDLYDEWDTRVTELCPKLQYQENGKWIDVPTEIEIQKN